MSPTKLGNTYVPSEGPDQCDIMFVGEAPGKDEEVQRRPFVGSSGSKLMEYLERNGLTRKEVFLTNLCKYRPQKNQFRHCLETQKLAEGLEELKAEIKRVKPTVIVACGGWPTYYLTGKFQGKPGSGILSWRGTVLPNTLIPSGPKVLATVHPAFVLRSWTSGPILNLDIQRAVEDSRYSEIRYPEYTSIIDPPSDQAALIVEEMSQADLVSCDIETFKGTELACIGFADSASRGVCFTKLNMDSFMWARRLYESDVPKVFQYGTYDVNFLHYFYEWRVGGYGAHAGWDTYIAAATLMPEFPRGLDFLTSIYTRMPYYKEERKIWKDEGDLNILWEYNIKDVIATYLIAVEQQREIEELFPNREDLS